MVDTRTQERSMMVAVSDAMVRLHKEQFGRGPTRARSNFAGPDVLVCVLEDVLLPAELELVAMEEQQRVRETRMFMQVATSRQFTGAVQDIVGREVWAFASATDPDRNVVIENFVFAPAHNGDVNGNGNGNGAVPAV
jgi:uncharacterized protein YbcI